MNEPPKLTQVTNETAEDLNLLAIKEFHQLLTGSIIFMTFAWDSKPARKKSKVPEDWRTPRRFAKFNRRRNSRSVWTAVTLAPLLAARGTSTIPASLPARQRR